MMSKPSSWNASFKGVDRIIHFDNIEGLDYHKSRGKVRKIAADLFGCNCKNPELRVKLHKPDKQQDRISAALQRSLGPQSTLRSFGVV